MLDGDGTNLSRACLADNLAELEVVPNPDQREVNEWSEEESDGDESDEDVGFDLHIAEALRGLD